MTKHSFSGVPLHNLFAMLWHWTDPTSTITFGEDIVLKSGLFQAKLLIVILYLWGNLNHIFQIYSMLSFRHE
jgi:hypothetical protein